MHEIIVKQKLFALLSHAERPSPSLASQTFARKTGGSGDISIAVAVPVERTECNFCCVINLNSCACRFINIALQ